MHPLQPHHTFSLSAKCKKLSTILTEEQLKSVDFSKEFYVLGEGSNTVFIEDFTGTVLKIANKGILITEQQDVWHVRAAAGENWHQLVIHLLEQGVFGFENLALIPGTVGAAPVQNIGAYGVEVGQFVKSVKGYDIGKAQFVELAQAECDFAYRESVFKQALKDKFIITEVLFELTKQWQPVLDYGPLQSLDINTVTAQQVFNKVIEIRQSKLPDPKELANAGSFFKNPIVGSEQVQALLKQYPDMPNYPADAKHTKLAAGWLIEQVGLKGFELGGIAVYHKQALVLVNQGAGTASELKAMVQHIQQSVWQKFNVQLEHEVRVIAANGTVQLQGVQA
ncbi:MAG: UDP-N-acetylmuramate dehydrogenase [Pseudomonadota bacterium]